MRLQQGVKTLAEHISKEKALSESEFTRYRAMAACANYLAAGRPDAQYAAKEVCRFMSAPTDLSMLALKRLGRHLAGRPRLVFFATTSSPRLHWRRTAILIGLYA